MRRKTKKKEIYQSICLVRSYTFNESFVDNTKMIKKNI